MEMLPVYVECKNEEGQRRDVMLYRDSLGRFYFMDNMEELDQMAEDEIKEWYSIH